MVHEWMIPLINYIHINADTILLQKQQKRIEGGCSLILCLWQ